VSCSVHDVADIEGRGVPAVVVASSEFADGAAAQARSLGTEPVVVFVKHPIQDRTDDELRALADDAIQAIIAGLTAG
jgi:hypothetical protein